MASPKQAKHLLHFLLPPCSHLPGAPCEVRVPRPRQSFGWILGRGRETCWGLSWARCRHRRCLLLPMAAELPRAKASRLADVSVQLGEGQGHWGGLSLNRKR